nr:50S ribosomal protein L11 methyltransferase [Mesorhizobium sp. L-8-10]
MREKLHIVSPPLLPELRLHAAHSGSGLWRLAAGPDAGAGSAPPYWAYQWPGGIALARYLLDMPEIVAGLSVLDLGAGCGVVGIAAAKAGARQVTAAEIDRNAVVALGLNAMLNEVDIATLPADVMAGPPPPVDLVAVGDLFYDKALARRVTAFLDRCLAAGIGVLVGDPGRVHLPRSRLRLLADYAVPDVGQAGAGGSGAVFSFGPA